MESGLLWNNFHSLAAAAAAVMHHPSGQVAFSAKCLLVYCDVKVMIRTSLSEKIKKKQEATIYHVINGFLNKIVVCH